MASKRKSDQWLDFTFSTMGKITGTRSSHGLHYLHFDSPDLMLKCGQEMVRQARDLAKMYRLKPCRGKKK